MAIEVAIKKKIGNFCLDVAFSAGEEMFALLGASGCGKSMTLKCIAGIETPDEGKIILNGRTLFDSEKKINLIPQKRKVGYMFQDYALFPNMTVEKISWRAWEENRKRKSWRIISAVSVWKDWSIIFRGSFPGARNSVWRWPV